MKAFGPAPEEDDFPYFEQTGPSDCGIACMKMIAKFHGKHFEQSGLKKHLTPRGLNLQSLVQIAEKSGFECRALKGSFEAFRQEAILPCIVLIHRDHFVVVTQITPDFVKIADPGTGFFTFSHTEFQLAWVPGLDAEGIVLFLSP